MPRASCAPGTHGHGAGGGPVGEGGAERCGGLFLSSAAPLPNPHSNKFLSLQCGRGGPGLWRAWGRVGAAKGALSGMGAGSGVCGEGEVCESSPSGANRRVFSAHPQGPSPSLPHAHPGCMNRPMQKLPHVTPPPPKNKCHVPVPPIQSTFSKIKVSFSFTSGWFLTAKKVSLRSAGGLDVGSKCLSFPGGRINS